VTKPSGTIKRLSVAAVVDGTYEVITAGDGSKTQRYIQRTSKELEEFERIVKRAMGFDADREDQVQVSCFPLSVSAGTEAPDGTGIGWLAHGRQYIRLAINFVLLLVIFLFVVRPLLKSVKGIITTVETTKALPGSDEGSESAALPEAKVQGMREKTVMIAKSNSDKTQQVIKGWLHETE
jgi:flagellar M-ring protein FliF